MGLDLVELVLEVEETFSISLDDDEVAQVVTVGQFNDLILRKSSDTNLTGCPTANAFYRLRQSLIGVLGIPCKDVRPSTSVVALLPYWQRLHIWKRLEQNLALQLPPLSNQAGTSIIWTVGIIAPISFLTAAIGSGDLCSAFAVSLVSLLFAVLFGYIIGILFLPHAPFPQHRTVGGLPRQKRSPIFQFIF